MWNKNWPSYSTIRLAWTAGYLTEIAAQKNAVAAALNTTFLQAVAIKTAQVSRAEKRLHNLAVLINLAAPWQYSNKFGIALDLQRFSVFAKLWIQVRCLKWLFVCFLVFQDLYQLGAESVAPIAHLLYDGNERAAEFRQLIFRVAAHGVDDTLLDHTILH